MTALDFAVDTPKAQWRVDTLKTKEPETVAWIEAMPEGSVFWDIGANIGIYSLLAAQRGVMTVAVEPLPANYAALCRAIVRNGLSDLVFPICAALSNKCLPGYITFKADEAGNTLSGHGADLGILKTTLDHLVRVYGLPAPTHIKIDTDGSDWNALVGAVGALDAAQSVIIETANGTTEQRQIGELLDAEGFEMTGRYICPLFPHSPVGMDHWHRSKKDAHNA